MAATTEWINQKMDEAGYSDYTYASISGLIYCKLKTSVHRCIPIGPLADLVLEYANLAHFGIFMCISAIRMKGVNVTPVGSEYNVEFNLFGNNSVIDTFDHGRHEDGLNLPGTRKPDTVIDLRDAYALVSSYDVIGLGHHIKNAMNKPWWKDTEESAMGTACMLGLVKKAKIMLWRLIRREL